MNKLFNLFAITLFLMLVLLSCKQIESNAVNEENPAAPGFRTESSDSVAVSIADKVMEAMGGRENWDNTRYVKWNFFGSRRHIWDRQTGDLIIEGLRDSFFVKMNLKTMEGKATIGNNTLTNPDSLAEYLQKAHDMWINDSYWLLFPYKLKDSGVTLKYLKQDTTMEGQMSHVLELTFSNVGVTPDNKYYAYVDTSSNLVTQWDFFRNYTDSLPLFSRPWKDYETYGNIKLSSSRGDKYLLTELSVSDTLSQYFLDKDQ